LILNILITTERKIAKFEYDPTLSVVISGVNYNYLKIVNTSLYHYLISLGGDYINKVGKTPLDIQNLYLNITKLIFNLTVERT
jgi:hypothetical protein